MDEGFFHFKRPANEPVKAYQAESPEWEALRKELDSQAAAPIEIP